MKNIVFITIDECKATAMSTYGNKYVSTPAADHMSANGTQFNWSFTNSPKCVPSRCSMFSGRYSHSEGHRTLPGFELRKEEWNLISHLKKQGYSTVLIGNNHTIENDYLHEVFDEIPRNPRYAQSKIGIDASNMPTDSPEWRSFYRGPWNEAYDWHPSDVDYISCAADYVKRQHKKPFFLLLNLSLPHPNYYDMEEYITDVEAMDPPLIPVEHLEETPSTLRSYRKAYDLENLDEKSMKKVQNAYFSMVSFIDNKIKGFLDELEKLDIADDTLIIYTSDHGDFAGEHGCVEKYDTMFYDCLVRVPLFFKGKGIKSGQRIDELVEHVDIAPTILEALGMKIPAQIHGQSLWKVLTQNKKINRKYVFCEGGVENSAIDNAPHYDSPECIRMKPDYYWKQKAAIDYKPSMQRAKMIRSDNWKLIYRLDGSKELYNMKADPHELVNAAGDPDNSSIVIEMMEALLQWCIRTETEYPPISSLFA